MTTDDRYPPFLGSEVRPTSPGDALFHVLPVPLEETVSYGSGTGGGASAILRASQQLEGFDGRTMVGASGIHTFPPVDCSGSMEETLGRVESAAAATAGAGKIPIVLGGEHTVTVGAVRGVAETRERLGVVQIDAHADLRDRYEGTRYSHACVGRRLCEAGIPLFQVGVRSLSQDEAAFRQDAGVGSLDAWEIAERGLPETVLPIGFPEEVYLSIDVDGFDPSVFPATGTPEPGGLGWWEGMTLLERIAAERRIVGFDVTELAPVRGLHFPEYAAARLVFNLAGMVLRNRTPA